jgi:hypothetical protein
MVLKIGSAVGALIAQFILGVRDRHEYNLMLLKAEPGRKANQQRLCSIEYVWCCRLCVFVCLCSRFSPCFYLVCCCCCCCCMCNSFGYVYNESPGGAPLAIDTPRLTLQSELIKLLRATKSKNNNRSLLDDVQKDLVQAYVLLRRHYPSIVAFAKVAFASVYSSSKIESFMWGRYVFRASSTERAARDWFADKVVQQLNEVVFRRGLKMQLVKAYYVRLLCVCVSLSLATDALYPRAHQNHQSNQIKIYSTGIQKISNVAELRARSSTQQRKERSRYIAL